MDVMYSHCCGLDVHKKTITACIITPKGKELKTFGTMTPDLLNLADWIKAKGCTHVAMESTGVYWKPIYSILEHYDLKDVLVVNAHHIKNVPGRKTDTNDAPWIPICSVTVYLEAVSSKIVSRGNSKSLLATARAWLRNAPGK